MLTCNRCGRPSDDFTCTLCRNIERERREDAEREEEAREESRANAERAAYARTNPGDYECPECLYRTLRY